MFALGCRDVFRLTNILVLRSKTKPNFAQSPHNARGVLPFARMVHLMQLTRPERFMAEGGVIALCACAFALLGIFTPPGMPLGTRLVYWLIGFVASWALVRLLANVGGAVAKLLGVAVLLRLALAFSPCSMCSILGWIFRARPLNLSRHRSTLVQAIAPFTNAYPPAFPTSSLYRWKITIRVFMPLAEVRWC